MKPIAVALALIVLTAQAGHASPTVPIALPEWAAQLVARVPFIAYFASTFEDSREVTQAQRLESKQVLAPHAKGQAASVSQIEKLAEQYEARALARQAATKAMQPASQR